MAIWESRGRNVPKHSPWGRARASP